MSRAIIDSQISHRSNPAHAIMLGVTPELAQMCQDLGLNLTAFDRSDRMLREVWPGNRPGIRAAVAADWDALPLVPASCDLVLGDCSFTATQFPDGHQRILQSLARILRRDALMVIRCRVRPEVGESLDTLCDLVQQGRIGSFHAFKMRFAMAMRTSSQRSVSMNETWSEFQRRLPDRSAMSRQCGWTAQDIDTIDFYRGKPIRFWFPTLSELRRVHATYFVDQAVHLPDYETGDRHPIFVLRPRDGH